MRATATSANTFFRSWPWLVNLFPLLISQQVEEQRVSGGVDLNYFHEPIGSIYQGLGNIMLRLEPTDRPAAANATLLLNAHYDSTLGSQGGPSPSPPRPPFPPSSQPLMITCVASSCVINSAHYTAVLLYNQKC